MRKAMLRMSIEERRHYLEIKINKEIRDYQEAVFMGLSLRQFLFSLLAIAVAVGVYFGLQGVLGAETISWLCVIAAFPFAILGFVKYHGGAVHQGVHPVGVHDAEAVEVKADKHVRHPAEGNEMEGGAAA